MFISEVNPIPAEIDAAMEAEADRLMHAWDVHTDAAERATNMADVGRPVDPLTMEVLAQSRAMMAEHVWAMQGLAWLRVAARH